MLTDDLVFYSAKYRGMFIAPRGFQHNLASIPQIAQSIIPKVGRYDKAAVIHDGAYGNVLTTEDGKRIFCVKRVADDLFYEGMKAEGVNGLLAWMMHRAVVIGGNPAGHPLANALPEVA